MKEAPLQLAIVESLQYCGLEVYETSTHRQKGSSGVDKGIADLLVPHPCLRYTALCIEVKRPGNIRWSSPEQRRAAELAHTIVVRGIEEALDAVAEWLGEVPGDGAKSRDTLRRIERFRAGMQ